MRYSIFELFKLVIIFLLFSIWLPIQSLSHISIWCVEEFQYIWSFHSPWYPNESTGLRLIPSSALSEWLWIAFALLKCGKWLSTWNDGPSGPCRWMARRGKSRWGSQSSPSPQTVSSCCRPKESPKVCPCKHRGSSLWSSCWWTSACELWEGTSSRRRVPTVPAQSDSRWVRRTEDSSRDSSWSCSDAHSFWAQWSSSRLKWRWFPQRASWRWSFFLPRWHQAIRKLLLSLLQRRDYQQQLCTFCDCQE